jgi:hypothetical protein
LRQLSNDNYPKAGEHPISPSEFTVSQIESSDNRLSISISNSPASGSVTSFTDASATSDSMNLSQHGLGLLAEAALHGCEQSPSKGKRQRDVAGPLDQNKRRLCVNRSEQDHPADVMVVNLSDNINLGTNAEDGASCQSESDCYYVLKDFC